MKWRIVLTRIFSIDRSFPFIVFFPLSLFFMAKKSDPRPNVPFGTGGKKRPANSKGSVV
jgi:hypothetical protein